MARYRDVPDKLKIQSEMIEPAFASIYGRLFAQAQYMKDQYGAASMEHTDALENLWAAARAICDLAGLCIDTTHASVAASNHLGHVANHIEKELGFNPVFFGENAPFRSLVRVLKKKGLKQETEVDDEDDPIERLYSDSEDPTEI